MTSLDYAVRYVHRGWSIVPIIAGTKHPAVPLAPYLRGDQRMSEAEACTYWTEYPNAGIAIITGAPSSLVVCDVDVRNGGNVEEALRDCPSGLVSRTGGGGVHIFCRYPGIRTPKGRTSRKGVDRQADGGYAVAPPSIHPSGEPYTWLSQGPLGDLPAWVLESPRPAPPPGGITEPWVAHALAYETGTGNGEQEETLTRLAWWASRHLPEDIAREVLWRWAAGLPLHRPGDPWTIEHVVQRLSSAYAKRAAEDPGTDVRIVPGAAGPTDDLSRAQELAAKARTGDKFEVERHDRDDWIIADLIAEGCYCEIVGLMKAGKSTLVNQMMRCLCEGSPFLGKSVKAQPVVYLTEQAGRSLEATLKRGKILGNAQHHLLTIADMQGYSWRQRALAAVLCAEAAGSRVVVVDTLSRLADLSEDQENSAGHAMVTLNPWGEAKKRGIAVIFIRHSRKGDSTLGTAGRGSGAFTGDMDVCFHLKEVPGERDYRTLRVGGRLSEVEDFNLKYSGGDYEVVDEAPKQARRTHKFQSLLELIPAEGDGVTEKELADWLEKSKQTVSRMLAELRREGRVKWAGDGEPGSPRRYTVPATLDGG